MTKLNTKISLFLVFLVLSSLILDVKAKISEAEKMAMTFGTGRIDKDQSSSNSFYSNNLSNLSNLNKIESFMINRKLHDAAGIALNTVSACFGGIQNSLDPAFCWRKGKDIDLSWGTSCDSGWTKRLLSCVKNCSPGYSYKLGMCRRHCSSGYSMKGGILCYKNWYSMYFPSGYFPSRAWANCDKGFVRLAGNLCSKSCEWGKNKLTGKLEKTTMKNCGPLACSNSTIGCVGQIISMAIDTVVAVVTFIGFVTSFGASSAVAIPAKAAVAQVGKTGMKKAMEAALKQMVGTAEKIFRSKVVQYAQEKMVEHVYKKTTEIVCDSVMDNIKGKKGQMMEHFGEVDEETFVDDIVDTAISIADIFGIRGIIEECNKGIDSAGCIANILKAGSAVDPIGIFGLMATFVKPICNLEITPSEDTDSADKAIRSNIDELKPGCVKVYEHCHYKGESLVFCRDDDDPDKFSNFVKGDSWNNKISSIVTAKDTFGAFFQLTDMRGRHFTMGPEESFPCLNDLTVDSMNFNDFISSINVSLEVRQYFKIKWGWYGYPSPNGDPFGTSKLILKDNPKMEYSEYYSHMILYVVFEPFTAEYKLEICDDYNYKGKCIIIDEEWESEAYMKSDKALMAWHSMRILKNDIKK